MKPTNEIRVTSTSSDDSIRMGIRDEDMAKIVSILRDGMYTDRVLAVLREYSANAWDAHNMVGKGDLPIHVTVPSWNDLFLRIRDFGPGLSYEDVRTIYSQYGASTKRDSNTAVGCFGVGSKSGFAYSDAFTVISRHDGRKRTFVAVIDESEMGRIDLLDDSECDPEDTGVEIVIAVKAEDVNDFRSKASDLFQHFRPRPVINIALPSAPDEETVLVNGTITTQRYYGSEWVALMGCVPYRVNLQQLDQTKIAACLPELSGSLFFNIGDVAIATSREELRYNTATKAALVQKLNDLVDEYVVRALDDVEKPGLTGLDKRLKLQVLSKMRLPLPEDYEELAAVHVKVDVAPDTFVIVHNNNACTRISVYSSTRILIDDTDKKLSGYRLGSNDYVARGVGKTVDEVKVLLDAALKAATLDGIPVVLLSTLDWTAPWVKPKKVVNPKHRAKMFVFAPPAQSGKFYSPYSKYWESESVRVPTATDVYVILRNFSADNYHGFHEDYKEDAALAAALGETMPVVYGYKTSDKHPVTVTEGTPYNVWRETWIKSLMTPDRIKMVESYYWKNPTSFSTRDWPSQKAIDMLRTELGDLHPITVAFLKQRSSVVNDAIKALAKRGGITRADSEASASWDLLRTKYPLLFKDDHFNVLYGSSYNDPTDWFEYVKMADIIKGP